MSWYVCLCVLTCLYVHMYEYMYGCMNHMRYYTFRVMYDYIFLVAPYGVIPFCEAPLFVPNCILSTILPACKVSSENIRIFFSANLTPIVGPVNPFCLAYVKVKQITLRVHCTVSFKISLKSE